MKKFAFFLFIGLVVFPGLALADQAPLTKEEIKSFVVPNLMYVTARSEISLEISDQGNYFKDYRDGQQYLGYANLVYIYWVGTYGQKIQEAVEIDLLKVDGKWCFSKIFKLTNGIKLIQGPTKPLPAVPASPAKDTLVPLVEAALPGANDLMERFIDTNQVYQINQFNVGDPKFEWRGLDYDNAAYVYTGDMEYTLSDIRDKKHKNDQVWSCNCEVFMLYNIAKQKWECKVNTKNLQRIK